MTDDEACNARDWLTRARSGGSLAFTAIVRGHQRMVYSLALRMLGDRHEAEDLSQEAFMRLHRRLTLIQSDSHLVFWLRKVTTHLAIDRLRRMPRHEVVSLNREPDIASEPSAGDPLLAKQLRGLVEQLPPAPRAVMLLRYQEDLDLTEIAETLDMSVNTVKSHLRRSLAALRKRFPDSSLGEAGNLELDEDRAG